MKKLRAFNANLLILVLLLITSAAAYAQSITTQPPPDVTLTIGTSIGNGLRLDSTTLKSDRFMTQLDLTEDTVISEAQIIANQYITNQGDAGEADLTLPALSYVVSVTFIVSEVQVMELNPPSGELFDLNGLDLDADDVVDSDTTVGSKIVAYRQQIADASWQWFLDTIRGAWTDSGASD